MEKKAREPLRSASAIVKADCYNSSFNKKSVMYKCATPSIASFQKLNGISQNDGRIDIIHYFIG